MKAMRPKSEIYRRFRIFGWHIYITPRRLALRPSDHGYSNGYKKTRAERRRLTGNTCEGCGAPIDKYCCVWRMLPKDTPGRNMLENIRVICKNCHARANADGRFLPRLAQKGGAE